MAKTGLWYTNIAMFHGKKTSRTVVFSHFFALSERFILRKCPVVPESNDPVNNHWAWFCFYSSWLLGGLDPWNFMTFHSVGTDHPNWLSYSSEGWLNHQPVYSSWSQWLWRYLRSCGYPKSPQVSYSFSTTLGKCSSMTRPICGPPRRAGQTARPRR